jgi:hypothetical protein
VSEFCQTGLQGAPTEPFAVSFGAVGFHDPNGPDLRGSAGELRAKMEVLRAQHRREGWWESDQWLLMRWTPDGRHRSWVYKDGIVDEGRWAEAIGGVPDRFDVVSLASGSGQWGEMKLEAPALGFRGRDVRSVSAWVTTPTAGVDDAAAALREQLASCAEVPGVLTGYVHVDSIPDPYTAVMTDSSRLSADSFDVEVHGYYWAVLLTDGHVQRLGGSSRVKREAPCWRVENLSLGDRQGMLCILTESPTELDPERLVAWRAFLSPTLRAGYPVGFEDIGQRSTSFHRPLHLYEGPPVPEGVRFVLQFDHEPTGRPLPVDCADEVQDPDWPTCWLYPGPDFDGERHSALVEAVVNAWVTAGMAGQLFEVEGRLHSSTAATWDTDDGGTSALVWQFDPGSCNPIAAIERLAAALGELAGLLDGAILDHLEVA